MKYFDIPTIKAAIERLQNVSANWLLPSFVFAANDVGTDGFVDLSQRLGTDQFLDRYFNGKRLNIPPFPSGNNLLRPRLKSIRWDRGEFANDYMLRQDTKMWGNLFSSRGYREMRMQGFIEGNNAINRLTESFQAQFEEQIPEDFRFEDFLVWLFAFEGFPDEIDSWKALFRHFLRDHLNLDEFKPPYRGRFKLTQPPVLWPNTITQRPKDEEFIEQLAPRLAALLASGQRNRGGLDAAEDDLPPISPDDEVYATINAAIAARESFAFLLAGPPGTGKTRYARRLALKIAEGDKDRTLFLQFHPAIGYDDFIEGFRPVEADGSQTGVRYELGPRLFMSFAKKAAEAVDRKFVVVIDELNRGDVARIFGEVLTYLEPAYRKKEFTLSFSGQSAILPDNLIIIATANPYDRSVTDLDDALLRRFWVIELEPDAAVLRRHLQSRGVEENVINRTVRLFDIVNRTMPHGFGHTNFLKVRTIDDLAAVWIGRVRMAMKRSLMHNRQSFDAVVVQIEALLATRDEEEAEEVSAADSG